eukprot:1158661-Pelagomonas_calceolata.AAC.6
MSSAPHTSKTRLGGARTPAASTFVGPLHAACSHTGYIFGLARRVPEAASSLAKVDLLNEDITTSPEVDNHWVNEVITTSPEVDSECNSQCHMSVHCMHVWKLDHWVNEVITTTHELDIANTLRQLHMFMRITGLHLQVLAWGACRTQSRCSNLASPTIELRLIQGMVSPGKGIGQPYR